MILLITYRSPILWLLPIISAVFAYMISGGVVYLLAKYADLTVNGQSQSILGILVIGAGTDYALLLVARYREELRRHEDRHEAMAVALHRATPAILASAATVVVGMLCLAVADLDSTAGLGPVLAVGVACTFLVMVDPAPGPAGDLRSLGLLAEASDLRLSPSRPAPASGPGSDNASARGRALSGSSRPRCSRSLAWACSSSTPRPLDRGDLHQEVRLDPGPGPAGGPRPLRHLQHRPGGHQQRPDRRGAGGCRHGRRPRGGHTSAGHRRWPFVLRGAGGGRHLLDRGLRASWRRPGTPYTAWTGPTPWSAVGRGSTSTPRSPPSETTG